MALIKCAECSTRISSQAGSCPKCGMVLTEEVIEAQKAKEPSEAAQKVVGGILAGMVFLVFGGCVFTMANAGKGERYSPAAKRYATELYQDANQDIDDLYERGKEAIEKLPERHREYAREVLENKYEESKSTVRNSYEPIVGR